MNKKLGKKYIVTEEQKSQDCPSVVARTYFKIGVEYWESQNFKESEKWLRYASAKKHDIARSCLRNEIKTGLFKCTKTHINLFASEILRCLVMPNPSELDVKPLEKCLSNYLDKKYNLP